MATVTPIAISAYMVATPEVFALTGLIDCVVCFGET